MTITYEGAMGFANTEAERAEYASRHLKAELKRAGITYAGLANLLKNMDLGMKRKPAFQVSSLGKCSLQRFPSILSCNRQFGHQR